jgi:carboxy-terminal domain RNA polymerase II polypeptide A small phosphatase
MGGGGATQATQQQAPQASHQIDLGNN